MQTPTCPHCHKEIEILEPQDLDKEGLAPNVRARLIRTGRLPVWAKVRPERKTGEPKFFLFLKKDVEAVVDERRWEDFRKMGWDVDDPVVRRELEKLDKLNNRRKSG